VLSFNGSRISGSSDLEQALYRCDAGDTVELILYRSRQQITVQLTLDEAGK
jgi:S1-C subfamily serine protease